MGKFKEGPYGISIKIAFGKGVLAGICDPGLRDREYIVPGVERVVALAVKFPDFEDRETLTEQGVVRMEDGCCY